MRNKTPSTWTVFYANIREPGGFAETILGETAEEAAIFDANPDAWAANHYGVTVEQYREWLDCHGLPRCGAKTKAGKLCSQVIARELLDALEFVAEHRTHYCNIHRPSNVVHLSEKAAT